MEKLRWRALAHAALTLSAAVVLVLLALRAAWDVDPTYDAWFYHLPFASRLAGIIGPERYQFESAIEAAYAGFPKLGEWMQGWLWRFTGRPEAANFWALGVLTAYWFFLKKFSGVFWSFAVFTFLAVPLVLMHAALSYVDLPANLFLTAQLMLVLHMWLEPQNCSWKRMTAVILCGAAASATKYFMIPPALAAFFAAWKIFTDHTALSPAKRAACFGIGLVLIMAVPFKNIIFFGNPFYPVPVPFFETLFPCGMAEGYAGGADYLQGKPGWLGWLASQTEYMRSPFKLRIAHDWMAPWLPSQDSADPAERWMGGNFSVNFYFHTILFAVLTAFRSRRERIMRWIFFAASTSYACMAPQANELRYYLFWILFLMSQNLEMLFKIQGRPVAYMKTGYAAAVLGIFLTVVLLTRGLYLLPEHKSFEKLSAFRIQPQIAEQLKSGEKVCLLGYTPYTFLYALRKPGVSITAAKWVTGCPSGVRRFIRGKD